MHSLLENHYHILGLVYKISLFLLQFPKYNIISLFSSDLEVLQGVIHLPLNMILISADMPTIPIFAESY